MEGLWRTRCVVPDLESRLVPEGAINSSVSIEEKAETKQAAILPAKQDADKKKQNRLALNRVRCVMITLVVFFHSGLAFESDTDWSLLAPGLDRDYMAYLNLIIGRSSWPMDVFFTLAGYASFHSLRVRSVTDFVKDRSLRLVPSVTFGLLVLNPLTWYLWYVMAHVIDNVTGAWAEYSGFWDLYLNLYVDCFSGNSERCPNGSLCIQHLWYLIYLYLFCILGLPIFLLWKKFKAPRIDTSAKKFLVIASFFALPVLIWGTDLLWFLQPDLPVLRVFSKRNFLEFFIYIFFGYFLAWCDDAHEILLSLTYFFTGVSISLIPAMVLAGLVRGGTYAGRWGSIWERLLVVVFAKATMYAVWGLAHKHLPHLPKIMGRYFDYVADRAIAVYVLNNLLLLCVETALYFALAGTFMETYTVPRFLLMFLLTYGLCFAVYESLFRWKYTQPLVGMMRVSDLGPKKVVKTKAASEPGSK